MPDAVGKVHAALSRVGLFAGLPGDVLQRLADGARVRRLPTGQVVFTAGDPADSLLVVLDGGIKVTVRSADGGELALTTVEADAILGELGVVDGGPRSTDAVAVHPTEIALISREEIHGLMHDHPEVTQRLLMAVARSLRRLTDTTADLVFLDLPRRIAKLLLDQQPDVAGRVLTGTSQEDIAHRVAGTRQSVNAALRGFERRGWIGMGHRHVIVKQRQALARFVGD